MTQTSSTTSTNSCIRMNDKKDILLEMKIRQLQRVHDELQGPLMNRSVLIPFIGTSTELVTNKNHSIPTQDGGRTVVVAYLPGILHPDHRNNKDIKDDDNNNNNEEEYVTVRTDRIKTTNTTTTIVSSGLKNNSMISENQSNNQPVVEQVMTRKEARQLIRNEIDSLRPPKQKLADNNLERQKRLDPPPEQKQQQQHVSNSNNKVDVITKTTTAKSLKEKEVVVTTTKNVTIKDKTNQTKEESMKPPPIVKIPEEPKMKPTKNSNLIKDNILPMSFFEIREEMDDNGNIINGEAVNVSRQLELLHNTQQQKQHEEQQQQPYQEEKSDHDLPSSSYVQSNRMKSANHSKNEFTNQVLDNNHLNHSTDDKVVVVVAEEEDDDGSNDKTIVSKLKPLSSTEYNTLATKLEKLALAEERNEREKILNVKSSIGLQSKGWAKGFFNTPSTKKKNSSTTSSNNTVKQTSSKVNTNLLSSTGSPSIKKNVVKDPSQASTIHLNSKQMVVNETNQTTLIPNVVVDNKMVTTTTTEQAESSVSSLYTTTTNPTNTERKVAFVHESQYDIQEIPRIGERSVKDEIRRVPSRPIHFLNENKQPFGFINQCKKKTEYEEDDDDDEEKIRRDRFSETQPTITNNTTIRRTNKISSPAAIANVVHETKRIRKKKIVSGKVIQHNFVTKVEQPQQQQQQQQYPMIQRDDVNEKVDDDDDGMEDHGTKRVSRFVQQRQRINQQQFQY